jgi:glycosyltransferase involved in cell wall biosynthesis
VRVLFLTRYTATGPSSRYRVVQFLPYLDRAGIAWEMHALLDERYLAARFARRAVSPLYLAGRALQRAATLLGSGRFDVVFVQKELYPWAPAIAERLLAGAGARVVLDVDDAIHLTYRGHGLLAPKVPDAMKSATAVLAGNRWLADYARTFNPRTLLFPTVVDAERFAPAAAPPQGATPVVGWIGSPETVRYLPAVADALARVHARVPFELRVVCAAPEPLPGLSMTSRPWSLATEADQVRQFDIGIMPLPDDEWARGKCSLKLLQYMSAGLPTVSSPRGSVEEIVRDGDNGFVAADAQAWEHKLATLLADAPARAAMGGRARAWLVEHYTLARYGPRFVAFLQAVAEGREPDVD